MTLTRFRPMLGASIPDYSSLRFPLIGSPKLDGIRAIRFGKEFMSRTLKTIPNRDVQKIFAELSDSMLGWDGELIVGDPTAKNVYRATNSTVMKLEGGNADMVRFFVFDCVNAPDEAFVARNAPIADLYPLVIKLDQVIISDLDELHNYEAKVLKEGYEGVILRAPMAPYKMGRSTLREQGMLKVKRFLDAEATVIGFEEKMHNANVLQRDARGYAKRSTHQDNKVPVGTLGALVCRTLDDREFRIGTGFTDVERSEIWADQDRYLGNAAKYKYFNVGIKDLPRHPVFLGWRA